MKNLLIIPPDSPDNPKEIIDLARVIKEKFPDCYISILVTLKNYDFYYNSSYFEGLVIEPKFWLGKLVLPDDEQFQAVLIFKKNLLWYLVSLRSRVRHKIVVYGDFSFENIDKIIAKLTQVY